MKKHILKLMVAVFASMGISSLSYASAEFYPTTSYWQTCWKTVTASSFKGDAKEDMLSIMITHNNEYHIPLMNQHNVNSREKIATYNNSVQAITMAMSASYDALREMQTTIQKSLMREKLNFLGQLTQDGINHNHYGLFVDQNGADGNINANAQSFSYYKNMCRRNKMFSEAFTPTTRTAKNLRISSIVSDQKEYTLNSISPISIASVKNEMHYNEFCSTNDISNGICTNNKIRLCSEPRPDGGQLACIDDKVVKSNALVQADFLLSPKGDKDTNSVKGELFKTDSTYTDEEEAAARAFAFNIVYSAPVTSPSRVEKTSSEKSEFAALYKQYIASLDLASYSFNNAIEERSVISDGELKLSKRDILKYIHSNLKNPDNITTASSGKDKAMEIYLFTAQSLKNKIEYDRIEQNERIEALLSSILSKVANSADNLRHSEYYNR